MKSNQQSGLLSPWVDAIRMKKVAAIIPAESRVLDLGCGPGLLIPHLPVGCAYVGVDHDSKLVANNKKEFPKHFFRELDISATILPFNDGAFDVVVLTAVLEHIKNPRVLFSEVGRVVSFSGVVVATTRSEWGNRLHGILASVQFLHREAAPRRGVFLTKEKLSEFLPHTGLHVQAHRSFQLGLNQMFILKKELPRE